MSQRTLAGVAPADGVEGLLNVLGADNLFQSRQPIQNPASVIGRQRTSSLMHASHSLHVVGGAKQTQGNVRLGLAPISTVLGLPSPSTWSIALFARFTRKTTRCGEPSYSYGHSQ